MSDFYTNEEKLKMEKWVESWIKYQMKKNIKINNMMSNTEYLEWLDQFTIDKEEFADDDWLYHPEQINDYDKEKVKDLSLFYFGIQDYAIGNQINPTDCEFGNYYRVKLNELGFEIGILIGQGTIFFCKKVSIDEEKEFIDFNDIIEFNKKDRPKLFIKK